MDDGLGRGCLDHQVNLFDSYEYIVAALNVETFEHARLYIDFEAMTSFFEFDLFGTIERIAARG